MQVYIKTKKMANKVKFKVVSDLFSSGIKYYDIELTDTDNDVSRYIVKDYYSADKEKIELTLIEAIKGDCDVENEDVSCDSYLGKKIIEFLQEGKTMSKSEQAELQNSINEGKYNDACNRIFENWNKI